MARLDAGRLASGRDPPGAEIAFVGHVPAVSGAVGGLEGDGVKGADHGAHRAGLAKCGIEDDCPAFRIPAKRPGGAGIKALRRVAMTAGEGECLLVDAEHPDVHFRLAVAKGCEQGAAGVVFHCAGGFACLAGEALLIIDENPFHRIFSLSMGMVMVVDMVMAGGARAGRGVEQGGQLCYCRRIVRSDGPS